MNPIRTFHYVYIIRNEKDDNYTGCTNDLKKRITEHEQGKSTYTKSRGPYKLIYYEACLDKDDAYRRERYLKTSMGKRYIKNRLNSYLREEF